jgi:N-acetylmuramoyl-L-alanine amidase
VRDLQRRLALAGFAQVTAEFGTYCRATEAAVGDFQEARGLRRTGICDDATWAALVEAGWKLGDRLLRLTSPNLRGDDVAVLQGELGRLGFDAGRADGIFGPKTARALREFQRSCGMSGDGVCGPDTVRLLLRLGRQSGHGPGVSSLREAEQVRALPDIPSCRLVIGQFGGLSSLARAAARAVRRLGAEVVVVDEPDALVHADAANRFQAHAYIGFEASFDEESTIEFYAVPQFESTAGRALAQLLAAAWTPTLLHAPLVRGVRRPVLRETRMPAVCCRLGPVRRVVDEAPLLAEALADAVHAWVEPTDQPSTTVANPRL